MFTSNHIFLLILCTLLVAAGLIVSVRKKLSSRTASVIFLVICCISEAVKDMVSIIPDPYGPGYILDPYDIPLMLCSLAVIFMFPVVFTGNEETREKINCAIVVGGVIAPAFSLLLPTEGTDLGNPLTYQYFLYHAALWWYSLYHILTRKVDLSVKSWLRNLLYATVLAFLMLYANSALSVYNVNYFFLVKPPMEGLPILNLDHGWPAYFLTLLLIAYVSISVVHLPAILLKKHRKQPYTFFYSLFP